MVQLLTLFLLIGVNGSQAGSVRFAEDLVANGQGEMVSVSKLTQFPTQALNRHFPVRVLLTKYAANLEPGWTSEFQADHGMAVTDIMLDDAGETTLTGWFRQNLIAGEQILRAVGEKDAFIARLDADGNLLWLSQIGGLGEELTDRLYQSAQGLLMVRGQLESDAFFGNNLVSPNNTEEVFLARLNLNGQFTEVLNISRGQDQLDQQVGPSIVAIDQVDQWLLETEASSFDHNDRNDLPMTSTGSTTTPPNPDNPPGSGSNGSGGFSAPSFDRDLKETMPMTSTGSTTTPPNPDNPPGSGGFSAPSFDRDLKETMPMTSTGSTTTPPNPDNPPGSGGFSAPSFDRDLKETMPMTSTGSTTTPPNPDNPPGSGGFSAPSFDRDLKETMPMTSTGSTTTPPNPDNPPGSGNSGSGGFTAPSFDGSDLNATGRNLSGKSAA